MRRPYIVRISIPVSDFREQLATIHGAVLLRELAPGQVVVTMPEQAELVRLRALPGVVAADPDRLERPDR